MTDEKLLKEIYDEVEESFEAYNELKSRRDGDGIASLKFDTFFNLYREKKSAKANALRQRETNKPIVTIDQKSEPGAFVASHGESVKEIIER